MYGIFAYIWAIFGVNVGKYSIHGACGHYPLLTIDINHLSIDKQIMPPCLSRCSRLWGTKPGDSPTRPETTGQRVVSARHIMGIMWWGTNDSQDYYVRRFSAMAWGRNFWSLESLEMGISSEIEKQQKAKSVESCGAAKHHSSDVAPAEVSQNEALLPIDGWCFMENPPQIDDWWFLIIHSWPSFSHNVSDNLGYPPF